MISIHVLTTGSSDAFHLVKKIIIFFVDPNDIDTNSLCLMNP